MAYNKAREERRWCIWKSAEEAELRRLGVSEDIIARLHEYDWAVFNSVNIISLESHQFLA